ncbi:MAG: hypothetical protein AABZ53_11450 [Planctomycetota bacterium]
MAETIQNVVCGFGTDRDGVLTYLRGVMTDEDIEVIAASDYGYRIDENVAALRAIRQSGLVPCPLPWEPKEVCELTRWKQPDVFSPDQVSGATKQDVARARQRAFACAVLLWEAGDEARVNSMGENSTVAALIGSALVLEREAVSFTRGALAALLVRGTLEESEVGLVALGVVICTLADSREAARNGTGERLRLLSDALIAEERRVYEAGDAWTGDWLLRMTIYDQRHDLWRSLAKHFLVEPSRAHPPEADEVLRLIGGMLCG